MCVSLDNMTDSIPSTAADLTVTINTCIVFGVSFD